MENKIVFGLLALLLVLMAPAFAQKDPFIEIETDKNSYIEGETIIISGKVNTIISGTPVILELFSPTNIVDVAQITIAQDGNYSHTMIAKGPLWTKSGEYTIKALYGQGKTVETRFNFSKENIISVPSSVFEVSAGTSGTLDVKYTINGGIVKDMMIEQDMLTLNVIIESTDDGSILLEIPRELLDAKMEKNDDEEFIVRIDEIQTSYQEITTDSKTRTIKINFEEGDSNIEVIGTFIIPEFGTIAVMILVIGVITAISFTKNKIQLQI